MGYFLKKGSEERQMFFFIDKTSDLKKLPTSSKEGDSSNQSPYYKVSKGSAAFCIETSKFYILNSEDMWQECDLNNTLFSQILLGSAV